MCVVAIQHVKTRYYVAINAAGKLYCEATFNADCKFKENIFENYWNIYARLSSIEDAVQKVRPCALAYQTPSIKHFYKKYVTASYSETFAYGN